MTGNANGMMFFIFLLALAVSFPVSFALILFYRRAVLKSMNAQTDSPPQQRSENADSSTARVSPENPAPALPLITIYEGTSSIPLDAKAATLFGKMRFARWQAAAIYTLAGIGFALVMMLAFLYDLDGFFPLRVVLMTAIYAFPMVLVINIVAEPRRAGKFLTGAIYFFILASMYFAALALNLKLPLLSIAYLFLLMNLPGVIFLQVIMWRKIRAVAPLVLIFVSVAVSGAQLAISVGSSDDRVLRFLTWAGSFVGAGAKFVLFGIILAGISMLMPISWLILRRVGSRYEKKKISDQLITVNAVWLIFGIANSLLLTSSGVVWILAGFAAFVVYRTILRIGFRLIKSSSSSLDGKKLLVLRVFSLGKRSERLFAAVGSLWRYGGSVRLIAGPDLATSTVEPHEFLDFVSGKLARRFIDRTETLDLRFSETDDAPDPDGRFRVNDFFCRDNAWKTVLARLVRESDAVIMDLRDFSAQNSGCIYEIDELINHAPLERVVFVVGGNPHDERLLLQTARQSWERMKIISPNKNFESAARLCLFRLTNPNSGGALRQLLRALCVAATQKS